MFVVLNEVSAAKITRSPGFIPSSNIFINGALSAVVGLNPRTFRHKVDTIASLVVAPTALKAKAPSSE